MQDLKLSLWINVQRTFWVISHVSVEQKINVSFIHSFTFQKSWSAYKNHGYGTSKKQHVINIWLHKIHKTHNQPNQPSN
jgi:hypothetical protein